MNRNEVLTFKDPVICAKVDKLMKVSSKNWYKEHFRALLEIYVSKLTKKNDTPADKFIKSIRKKLLFEESECSSQRYAYKPMYLTYIE